MTIVQNSATFYSGVLIGDETRTGTAAAPTKVNGVQVNAAMEIQSTQGGLMLPRMTTAQIAALQNMGTGQVIFNTDTNTPVTIVNGTASGMMIKNYQMKVVGATNIENAFGPLGGPSVTTVIASGTNLPYYPMAIAGRVSILGNPFAGVPNSVTIEVSGAPTSGGRPLKYLGINNPLLLSGLAGVIPVNTATMAAAGYTDGGLLPALTAANQLVLTLGVAGGAWGTGTANANTTLIIDVFYI